MKRVEVGDTQIFSWINSGAAPDNIGHTIYTGSETVVSTGVGVSSGNGHYYRLAKVDSPGYYISEWRATIDSQPYVRRTPFKAVITEVD